MLEQLATFILSLAIAASSAVFGFETASASAHGVGSPEIVTARAALARQEAAERLVAALERAQLAQDEGRAQEHNGEEGEAASRDTAAEALTELIVTAPEAARPGLQNAFTQVTTAPTGEPEDAGQPAAVPPVSVPSAPVAPPADVPAGPPAEAPAGPPSDAPSGRP